MNNGEKGLFFEGKARIFLESKGFKILVSNARWRKTEVDIICEKYNNGMNEIYAVEVKFRSNPVFFSISNAQLTRIDLYMSMNFPGVFFKTLIILCSNTQIELIEL